MANTTGRVQNIHTGLALSLHEAIPTNDATVETGAILSDVEVAAVATY